MRVAYFNDTYRLGGAERFLADLAAGVAEAGHDVTVISPQPLVLDLVATASPGTELLQTSVDYSAASSWQAQLGALLRSLPELRAVIKRTRPDVLHVNNGGHPGSDLNRLATIVARFAGRPRCVLTVNSPASARSLSQPQLQALSDWLVWRSVDAVHSTSIFQQSSMSIRGMPLALSRHIPYGVREPDASTEEIAALRARLAPAELLIGMISATGEAEKGHAVLVEALARSGANASAVIVGPHPGDAFIALIGRLGLRERVHLEGPVPPTAVGPYLCAIDLLVVPSTAYESLPLVALEAMAAGKPVFASRLSGIPEAVVDGKTGRLFPTGDVERLAGLLREAAAEPGPLARLGRAGHERWTEEFSLGTMTRRMLALYGELLQGSASR